MDAFDGNKGAKPKELTFPLAMIIQDISVAMIEL